MKLNDTHRTILAAAGARETSRVLPLPKSLKLTTPKAESLLNALLSSELVAEQAISDGDIVWRTDDAAGKLTLVVTTAGLKAVGNEGPQSIEAAASPTLRTGRRAAKAPAKSTAGERNPPTTSASVASAPRANTKLAKVIAALRTKKGATIDDLTEATGWQAHSVRGAISGALKKKQGLNVVSTVVDGRGRVYRIAV
jgi:hypothetical protein